MIIEIGLNIYFIVNNHRSVSNMNQDQNDDLLFNASPVFLKEPKTGTKKWHIPIRKDDTTREICEYSRSWTDTSFPFQDQKTFKFEKKTSRKDKKNFSTSPTTNNKYSVRRYRHEPDYLSEQKYGGDCRPYNAIANCKSAGIIPYTIYCGQTYFLLQKIKNPLRKKESGWNDFGGKQIKPDETTAEIAAREFSEETSCLFYLKEQNDEKSMELFQILKNNEDLFYSEDTIKKLKSTILISQKYFADKINKYVSPIHISSKETYISFFIRVEYIKEQELPGAEDIHIPYENRYMRECKWFSYDEIMSLGEKDFHKRLQITRIQQRISTYNAKGLFM